MKEIVKGIFTWPWFSEPHGYNFNGYLICHESRNLCIDPVEPTDEVLEEIARQGVSRILLTNRNHSRAANRVRELTGGRTAIHVADAVHARLDSLVLGRVQRLVGLDIVVALAVAVGVEDKRRPALGCLLVASLVEPLRVDPADDAAGGAAAGEPQRVVGILGKNEMVRREARVDERKLARCRIVHRNLAPRALQGEQLG